MMRTSLVAVALSALSFASAQMKNFTIDVGALPASERAAWCQAELNTCGTLCVSTPDANSCNPDNLAYNCTCANGTAPGLQYYTETIYTFVCQQAFQDCITANVGNATGQEGCTTNIQDYCGTLDPDKFVPSSASSSSSSASTSATSTGAKGSSATASASATGAAASSTTSHAAAPTAAYLGNGVAVVAAGLFAAFL